MHARIRAGSRRVAASPASRQAAQPDAHAQAQTTRTSAIGGVGRELRDTIVCGIVPGLHVITLR